MFEDDVVGGDADIRPAELIEPPDIGLVVEPGSRIQHIGPRQLDDDGPLKHPVLVKHFVRHGVVVADKGIVCRKDSSEVAQVPMLHRVQVLLSRVELQQIWVLKTQATFDV